MGQNAATKVPPSLGILLNLATCATTPQPVEVPAPVLMPSTSELFVGAWVQIVKLDHTLVEFKVLEITPTGLRGKDGVVPYQEMRSLTILHPNADTVVPALGISGTLQVSALGWSERFVE